jgi:hypothetical protein
MSLGYLTAQMSRTIGVTVAAAAALAAFAPATAAGSVFTSAVARPSLQAAGTQYGGSAVDPKSRTVAPMLGLLVRPDGRISARASTGYSCRKHTYGWIYIRMSGKAEGAAISATGHTRLPGTGTMQVSLQGTADGQNATGTVSVRVRGCRGWSFPFTLHSETAPAGPAAAPPPSSNFTGMTAQAAAGVRLPVSVSVTHNGKVWAVWDASASCHPKTFPVTNVTPTTTVKPDGTFTRSERFKIRYTDGVTYHYAVRLTGAFHSDGVSGTLRASVRFTKPGHRYRPCSSGTQTWAARR